MRVDAPGVLRNGEFFEFRVQITARRDISEPVIAISAPYWLDVTINTMVPSPAEETFSGDAYQFKHEAVKAGDRGERNNDEQTNHARRGGSRVKGARRPGVTPVSPTPHATWE